ncbi:MAG: hypothetical protein EP329_14920 [Deltaproteobacteria bacterium]|nr:MAG: hypothetical protein EP329_14920 [Deltaproteobacteria bacterium]
MSEQLNMNFDAGSDNGLPPGWAATRLGEIAEVRLGRQRSPEKATGPNMRPYMRAANVTWDGISLHDVKEMDFTPSEAEVYVLQVGDILLAEASGSASEVGKPAVWKGQVPGACFQNTLIRVRAPGELVAFLHLHFVKDALTGEFARASRGVGIHHIGAKAVVRWPTALPPLPEQERIVAEIEKHFTRLDDAVATLERVKVKLERARASVLKAAVEGRLVPTEAELAKAEGRTYEPAADLLERILAERKRKHDEEQAAAGGKKKYTPPVEPDTDGLPELPEGWVWATTDQMTEFVTSGSRGWARYYSESGPLFIRSQDINTYRLDLSLVAHVELPAGAEGTRTRVQMGDVLIIITGANVTISAWVQADVGEAYVNQHVGLCRPVDVVTSPYLHTWLMAHGGGRPQLEKAAYGAGKPGLNLTNIRELRVALPPLHEQQRIVAEVERRLSVLDAAEQAVERNLTRCGNLRQSILKRAFEGKLVPQDPSDEPATALLARIQAEHGA